MSAGDFKTTLTQALHSAVASFNTDNDPNSAVVKAAQVHDLNAEQTTRLVETFNTARTIYHYKNASDRTGEFSLADSAAVISELFKPEDAAGVSEVDKAADAALHAYGAYDVIEVDYSDGLDVKEAGLRNLDLGQVTTFSDISIDTQVERFNTVVRSLDGTVKAANGEARVSASKAGGILSKLSDHLKLGYADVCADRYGRLVAGYKDDVEMAPVVAKLAEFVSPTLVKAAEALGFADVIDDRDLGDCLDLMKEAKFWMEAESSMLAMAGTLEKEASDFEAEFTATLAPLLPKGQVKEGGIEQFLNPKLLKAAAHEYGKAEHKEQSKSPMEMMAPQPVQQPEKQESGLPLPVPRSVTEGVSKGVTSGVADQLGGTLGKVLTGPTERANEALSDRLKNVQRQIMLEELLANDPILSEESPDAVVKAYDTVLKLAPEMASNKEVVRAVLRNAVHSMGVGAYEAQTLTELEKNIRSISGSPIPAAGGRPVGR